MRTFHLGNRRAAEAVRRALHDGERAASAQELYRLLHERGEGIGLATIYRALDGLVSAGVAERIRRDAEDTYVLCPALHHHHAICRQCGRTDVLQGSDLNETAPLESPRGFAIDGHQTVYFGRCPECDGREFRP